MEIVILSSWICDNSNIVIDGNAVIKQSVYGGGNYGATGLVPYQDRNGSKESTTNIKILGGTIEGSVYGGGNNNGSGGEATYTTSWWGGGTTYTTTVTSTININVSGGNIKNQFTVDLEYEEPSTETVM